MNASEQHCATCKHYFAEKIPDNGRPSWASPVTAVCEVLHLPALPWLKGDTVGCNEYRERFDLRAMVLKARSHAVDH